MAELPQRVAIDGAVFSRVESDDSIACWTVIRDAEHVGESRPASLVIEPAATPEPAVLELAATVVARFDEFSELAAGYLRQRLREPEFGLRRSEVATLNAPEAPFDEPEAVIWADGSWMLRFAESGLEMADPYGIGVLFDGTRPSGVEDLSDAGPA